MELPSRNAGIMLASAWAIMRKMFNFTGILSKEARMSPVAVSGSIRGSLATRLSLGLSLFRGCLGRALGCLIHILHRERRKEKSEIMVDGLDHLFARRSLRAHD